MEMICNDPVFGQMSYKHRWYKKESIFVFGKEWEIVIAAKAYSEKPITKEQQKAYSEYKSMEKEMFCIAEDIIKNYVNSIKDANIPKEDNGGTIQDNDELSGVVTPRTLMFKQDGTTLLLLDCVWDVESGIAVELSPNVRVGSQDIFL